MSLIRFLRGCEVVKTKLSKVLGNCGILYFEIKKILPYVWSRYHDYQGILILIKLDRQNAAVLAVVTHPAAAAAFMVGSQLSLQRPSISAPGQSGVERHMRCMHLRPGLDAPGAHQSRRSAPESILRACVGTSLLVSTRHRYLRVGIVAFAQKTNPARWGVGSSSMPPRIVSFRFDIPFQSQ